MRKSPCVAAVWTLKPNSLSAPRAASSHSGVEKASNAGLSVVLMNSNLFDMGLAEFEGGWDGGLAISAWLTPGLHAQAIHIGGGFAAGLFDHVDSSTDRAAFGAIKQ